LGRTMHRTVRRFSFKAAIFAVLACASQLCAGILDEETAGRMGREYVSRMTAPKAMPQTREEWMSRREVLRQEVLNCIGLNPFPYSKERPGDQLPLDVHFGGRLEYPQFTLSRVYWQTWQDVYASGYLYVPRGPGVKPAILCPHGHWQNGAKHPTVQARCISLARMGYVVLSVDSVHVRDYRIGLSPISVMTWNNMRGIDYLVSRPDVDPERIGCTGASGGGQQTLYLMAVEPRIVVASPVAIISYFKEIMTPEVVHCYCNHVPFLLRYTDEPEMAALFAPKPALFITLTGDWTAKFPKEGYPEIERVYSFFDARDKVKSIHIESRHDFNREMRQQVYAWFNRWLKEISDPALAEEPDDLPTEPVEKLESLDAPPPNARGFDMVVDEFIGRLGAAAPDVNTINRSGQWERFREKVGRDLQLITGEDTVVDEALDPKWLRREDRGEYVLSEIVLPSEMEVSVPGVLLVPREVQGKHPTVILVHEKGREFLLAGEKKLIEALLAKGVAVFASDTRYVGELNFGKEWRDLYGVIFGRTEVGVAAHDILRAVTFLEQEGKAAPGRIGCIAFGDRGVPAMVAAAMDKRIQAIAVVDVGQTYLSGRERPWFVNVLKIGDVPTIAAAIAPRPLYLHGITNPSEWEIVRDCYVSQQAEGNLRMSAMGGEPNDQEVVSWVIRDLLNCAAPSDARNTPPR
jgi:cephalosporin-C deacetylase-like acetyl esterase